MPQWKFRVYVVMMGAIQAEQSLSRINEIAAGTGSMEADVQKRYRRDLQQTAARGQRPKAVKATAASLAAMGISVETVERR